MHAENVQGGVRVNGVKRPCSLARSMDMLTASVLLQRGDNSSDQLAVVLIPANSPGIRVTPFWGSFALVGAESEQIAVEDVFVPDELVIRTTVSEGRSLDELQVAGFLWFELLICASYLGAASALVERALSDHRMSSTDRVRLVGELEAAMAGLENVARQIGPTTGDEELLGDALFARYAVQDTIARVVPRAVELLGGLRFIGSDDIAYLSAVVNGLGFHPPSRARMADPLAQFLAGHPLTIA